MTTSVFEDMSTILMGDRPSSLLHLMEHEILPELFPEFEVVIKFRTKQHSKNLWKHIKQVIDQTPKDLILRWAALYHDVGKPAVVKEAGKVTFYGHEAVSAKIWEVSALRLGVEKEFVDTVSLVIRRSGEFASITNNLHVSVTDAAVRRFVREIGEQNIERVYQFALADITTTDDAKRERMLIALNNLKTRIDKLVEEDHREILRLPKGFGNVLMSRFGLRGRALGQMMDYLTEGLVGGKLTLEDDLEVVVADLLNDACQVDRSNLERNLNGGSDGENE
jgi:putative nucleotidyltransferase with HDIG domain